MAEGIVFPYKPGQVPEDVKRRNALLYSQYLPVEEVEEEYYVVKDEKTGGSRAVTTNEYKAAEDTWKNIQKDAKISLDTDTGNITVKAPSLALQNKTFKERITPALEAISQNYKANKDYKYALMNNSEETKTSEEWVNELNKDLEQMVNQAVGMENTKAAVKESAGVEMSDEDVVKMGAVALEYNDATGQTVRVKDETMQALPKRIKELNVFKNLEGWDENSHMVSWGDLKKVWDRDVNSDEDIMAVFREVDAYFSEGDFSDTAEYAEMSALSQFINGKDPSVNFWRGAAEVVGEGMLAVITGAAEFDVTLMSAIETIANIPSGGKQFTGVKDFLEPEFENWKKARDEENRALSDVRAATRGVIHTVTPIAMEIALSVAAGNAASKMVGTSVSRVANSVMAKYATSAEELAKTAQILGFTGKAGTVGEAVAGAEGIAKSLYVGTDLSLKLMKASEAAKVIGQSFRTTAALGRLSAAAKGTMVVTSKMADILAQAVVDVTLTDRTLFRQFMESDDNEAKAYALEQLTMNAAGEIVGLSIGKGIAKLGETDLGLVLQAKTAPAIAGMKAKIGQAADNIKTAFHGGDKDWLVNKVKKLSEEADKASNKSSDWFSRIASNRAAKAERQLQNLAERRVLRQANVKISELAGSVKGDTWEETLEAARKVKGKMADTLAEANNVINQMYRRDVSTIVARFFMDNSNLSGARTSYIDALSKVLDAEDAAGLGGKARRGMDIKGLTDAKSGKAMRFGILNEQTNEYILGQYRLAEAEAVIAKSDIAENIAGAKKEKEYYEAIVDNFRTTQPQELVDAADNLLAEGKKLSRYTQDLRVKEGVLADEALQSMRTSGYFDEGYMRTQRAKTWEAYRKKGGELKVPELWGEQQYKWGDTDPFQDITLVLFDDINEVARQTNRLKTVNMLKGLGFKVDTVVTAEQTRISSEANKKVVNKASKVLEQNTKKAVVNADTTFFEDFFDKKGAEWFVGSAEKQAETATAKLAAAQVIEPKVSRKMRHDFFYTAPESTIDDILVSDTKSAFSVGVTDDASVKEFRKALDLNSRRALDTKMGDALGVGEVKDGIRKLSKKDLERVYTFDNFKEVVVDDSAFLDNFKRAYAEKHFKNSMDDIVSDIHRDAEVLRTKTIYKDSLDNLENVRKKYDIPDFGQNVARDVEDFLDDIIKNNLDNPEFKKIVDTLESGVNTADELAEYTTLQSLWKNRKSLKGQFYAKADAAYNKALSDNFKAKYSGEVLKKKKQSVDKMSKRFADESSRMLIDRLEQRYGEIANRLMSQGSDLITEEARRDIFSHIADLNKEIAGAIKGDNIIKTYGAFGYEEYVELSPTVASMFTTMPRPIRRGAFGTIQQEFVRTFRIGTTGGFVPGSLVNQAFRDTGNALVMGDAVKSNARVEKELAELFGDRFAEEYQRTIPDVYETLLKKSEETGTDIKRLIARREMEIGGLNVESELERNIYQFGREAKVARNANGVYDQTVWENITGKLDDFQGKLETLNSARESYLRKRVYNNNLLAAMKQGMSIQEARKIAEFVQSEATTNFVRQSYHLANLSKTVPYLGSAINGSKSFWRLASWDPVGVATRIIGGYVVPVIALTNMSFSNEENRRIYKQIPEYEKEDHLTFVLDGQILSIPIPQEISNFVVPIQHMIESMYGANDNSFAELMANDLLGAFPIELNGFINVDSDRILEGDIVNRHLLPGFAKVSSSLMPPLVKSGFMMVTGVDPYTMKTIDRNNVQIDPETGEQVVMDYTSGEAAKFIGGLMGDFMSPAMAQKVFSNLFGQGGMLVADGVVELAQAVTDPEKSVWKDGIAQAGQQFAEHGLGRLTVTRYGEQSNIAWNRAVSKLWEEKKAILSDPSYAADLKALGDSALSESARNEVESRVKTRRQEFMDRVLKAANNLAAQYDGTFDRYKFASVISLMNMDSGSVNENPFNSYATYLSKQDWNINKAAAVETMARMGFSGPNDGSIFGYYGEDQDGNITIQYNSPVNILNYELGNRYHDEIAFADINDIINEKHLYNEWEAYDKQIQAIYDKKKKTKQDYANIERLQINWNSHVAELIAPVVSKMTPEAAINNKKVRDLLYAYIYVPSSYQTNNKGRRVSLGDDGSKKAAYYQSFIKRMFGINDKYKGQY